MDDWIRYYNVVVAVGIALAGTPQLRELFDTTQRERLHWLSTIFLNVTALWGTIESLKAGYPGGFRVYLLAMALTWLFVAVAYRPWELLQERRRGRIQPIASTEESR